MCTFEWREGGRGGIAERCGRRGPLLQGSTPGCSKIPKMFGTSTEELAIDRPSFCLAMVFFFFFSFCLVVWCQNAISVSCIMSCEYVIMVWECGCVRLQGSFLPPRRWHHAWCAWVFVSVFVHTCTYFLVNVLFSLRCWPTVNINYYYYYYYWFSRFL